MVRPSEADPTGYGNLVGGLTSEDLLKILNRFVDWLGIYGETSWDHQSYFAGPVGGRAKARPPTGPAK